MIRFLGNNIPENTSLLHAVSYIFGIGNNTGLKICKHLGFSKDIKITKLNESQIQEIQRWIETNKIIELDLRKRIDDSLKNIQGIHCYRAIRHRFGLPVRGQRTHSNAKTQKKRHSIRSYVSSKKIK